VSDYDELFPSIYLRATQLEKPVTVTVAKAYAGKMETRDKTELRGFVKFDGVEKELVLNKTNFRSLAEIAKSEKMSDWAGLIVELYVIDVQTKDGMKKGIRIRAPERKGKDARAFMPEKKAPISKIDEAFEDEEGV